VLIIPYNVQPSRLLHRFFSAFIPPPGLSLACCTSRSITDLIRHLYQQYLKPIQVLSTLLLEFSPRNLGFLMRIPRNLGFHPIFTCVPFTIYRPHLAPNFVLGPLHCPNLTTATAFCAVHLQPTLTDCRRSKISLHGSQSCINHLQSSFHKITTTPSGHPTGLHSGQSYSFCFPQPDL